MGFFHFTTKKRQKPHHHIFTEDSRKVQKKNKNQKIKFF